MKMKDNKGININSNNKDFKVPDNYFEQLKGDIKDSTKSLNIGKKSKNKRLYFTIPSYAAAAAILLLVTFKIFNIQQQDVIDSVSVIAHNDVIDQNIEMEVYNDELAFISEDELIDMILENEFGEDINIEFSSPEHIQINQNTAIAQEYDYSDFDIIDEYMSEDELIDLLIE